MKIKTFLFSIFFLAAVLVCTAGAVTGLALPFYAGPVLDLAQIEQVLALKDYEQAALGATFYIMQNSDKTDIGRAFTLLGMALLKSDQPESAAKVFSVAAKSDDELNDLAAFYRILALEQAGDPTKTLEAIDQFFTDFPGTRFRDRLFQIRAGLLSGKGKYRDAAIAYLSLGDLPAQMNDYSKYRILAAQNYIDAKEIDSARKTLLEVLLNAPAGRFTLKALSLYDSISDKWNSAIYKSGIKWAEEGSYRQAVPILKKLLEVKTGRKAPKSELIELKSDLAYALFRIHGNEEGLKLYNELITHRASEDRAHWLYRKAKILTRMGDNKASQEVFGQILKEHSSSGYVRAARYQLALIDMEDNRYKKAYRYFKERIKKPASSMEYLTWLAAWCAYRNDYLDTAGNYLDTLLKNYKKSRYRSRYKYWRGRIYAQKKNDKEAIALFKSINKSSPMTYYGIKSYVELESRKIYGRSIQKVLNNGPDDGSFPPALSKELLNESDDIAFNRIGAMSRACMNEEIPEEIDFLAGKYENEKPVLYGFAKLYREHGAYTAAMNLARKNGLYTYCKSFTGSIGSCYFNFTYPAGYSEIVLPYTKKFKLKPEVVYALIHQESRYRPAVVSPADAVGLMQIIPQTGYEIAKDLGAETFDLDDLYNPETNIHFGTYYLRKVLDKFDQKLPYALASYNAGPDVVKKWVRNKGNLPDEIFIEEIPYKETNLYVKKILANIAIYKALYRL